MHNDSTAHIFYACDEAFLKYTMVSLRSMMDNASASYKYHIHVLHNGASEEAKSAFDVMNNMNFKITFDDVSSYLDGICEKLPIRDYYSNTTYYRMFIAEMYPEIDKALYIDSDTVVTGDVSELFETDISGYDLAACHEQAMEQVDVYGTYAEVCLGINRHAYFNAGIILINCKRFREKKVLERFVKLLEIYDFRVTQDEDYLNVICKDHVLFLPQYWNAEVFGEMEYPPEECKILHYIMVSKPWHYKDCRLGDVFWKYAERTSAYEEIKSVLENYTDEERARDAESLDNLAALAKSETERPDTYVARVAERRDAGRNAVLAKIEELERTGKFDVDAEEDPPTRPIKAGEVDFFSKKLSSKIARRIAYFSARRFAYRKMRENKLIVTDVKGVENLKDLKGGAVITCNHFNAFDSFAVQIAYERAGYNDTKPRLYRVIREGNYTSFPGFYGYLMRHCNTLPLASSHTALKEFMNATETLLKDGNFVLVYPEQSMWWNYRKPKPLKPGAFRFAAKCGVPVVPCFITMRDSKFTDDDGFPVQEYTVHIAEPIYPDEGLSVREASEKMAEENFAVWKKIYEREYAVPLEYLTEAPVGEGTEE
ncbi:MAG: 1-acyl-sn-glycerol-3-phosphate acyltransferase [Clostridia bacterium]|nr:1-acyl-sn-glycerol-3-phosphate acyltransferase [Clostridia bacterium]